MPPQKNKPTRHRSRRFILAVSGALAGLGAAALALILDPAANLPADCGAGESASQLYEDPRQITIDGYNDDCMEPFVTGDGNYLLFNNSNSPFVQTHIHLCKRVADDRFQHLGLLPGALSQSKDMAPSIDADGNLYFTSLRSFDKDGNSIYVGKFAKEKLQQVELPPGDISPHRPATINMDCDISKDGSTLILSRAHFNNPILPPDQSDLGIASKKNGVFSCEPDAQTLLSNLNTGALEYAPCLSADQRELFFTRASLRAEGKSKKPSPYLRIMVAKRENISLPFGKPAVLSALRGFIEAPTITDDKSEMFFHKKVKDKFRIFRARRNTNTTQEN